MSERPNLHLAEWPLDDEDLSRNRARSVIQYALALEADRDRVREALRAIGETPFVPFATVGDYVAFIRDLTSAALNERSEGG